MLGCLGFVGFVKIDAQRHPVTPLLVAAAACAVLWFIVAGARRREARRAARGPKDPRRR